MACGVLSGIPFAGMVLSAVNTGSEWLETAQRTAEFVAISKLVPDSDPCSMGIFAESLARTSTLARRDRISRCLSQNQIKKEESKKIRELLEKFIDDAQLNYFFEREHHPIVMLAVNDFHRVIECICSNSYYYYLSAATDAISFILNSIAGINNTAYGRVDATMMAKDLQSLPIAAEVTMPLPHPMRQLVLMRRHRGDLSRWSSS